MYVHIIEGKSFPRTSPTSETKYGGGVSHTFVSATEEILWGKIIPQREIRIPIQQNK